MVAITVTTPDTATSIGKNILKNCLPLEKGEGVGGGVGVGGGGEGRNKSTSRFHSN